jgi:hypothetical protein
MTTKRRWLWGLLILLLLLWYWWKHRRPTVEPEPKLPPPAEESPPPLSQPVSSAPGGYVTMAGYALNDTSDAALDALSPETIAKLNAVDYYSFRNHGYMGVGLYQAWKNIRQNASDTDEVKHQIQGVLLGYITKDTNYTGM